MVRVLFSLVCLIILGSSTTSAQIVLQNQALSWKSSQFYIAGVLDERGNKGAFARVIRTDASGRLVSKAENLQGGFVPALNKYFSHTYAQNRSLHAVHISVKQMSLNETLLANGSIEGKIQVNLGLGLKKNYGTEPLTSSRFALNYRRTAADTRVIETHIRKVLNSGLLYFDKWINTHVQTDWRLAKQVNIRFSDYFDKTEGDTIYYSASRPIRWSDFRSTNINSHKFDAIVIPGIGYDMTSRLEKGHINVEIAVKAYLPKSAAWVRPSAKLDYVLNHEQRHFDIVKIIAEEFKQKVRAARLTPDTYEAFLNMQYLDTLRDLDKMQKAYDTETSHGTNKAAQQRWNQQIDQKLKPVLAKNNQLKY